jgi:hypothetical protein
MSWFEFNPASPGSANTRGFSAARLPVRWRCWFAAAALLMLGAPLAAHAQTQTLCPPAVKEEVAKALADKAGAPESEQLALQAQLYEKYKSCAGDAQFVLPDDGFRVAARQCGAKVTKLGSLYFEEMPCCGYDPQRRTFACPVKIKQVGGFGGAPLPGSREYVLHCVADAAGVMRPVGDDSVHLSNALPGNMPTWQFAVVANAVRNLQLVQPMNNQTRQARSILSWALLPTSCDYQPIWGNAIDYRIRLDQ